MKLANSDPTEIVNYIESCDSLSKNLRDVFNYCVLATACGTEDMPQEICGSLSFLHLFIEIIEKMEKG